MKGNVWNIMRKEFARFFGDRTLLFTVVLLPGMMIYLIYSLIGKQIESESHPDVESPTIVYVNNMPSSLAQNFETLPFAIVRNTFSFDSLKSLLDDDANNMLYVSFPELFDADVAQYELSSGLSAPNIKIYYNSSSPQSLLAYNILRENLDIYENTLSNKFDINRCDDSSEKYDVAEDGAAVGKMLGRVIPIILLSFMFSSCLSIVPTSIAGEKERGTIYTLLVTPLSRVQLAMGKVFSLSILALLGGLGSFIGVLLSLPKMWEATGANINGSIISYADVLQLLPIILSTTLLLTSLISLISTFAKSVKTAASMSMPLMLIVLLASFVPMFNGSSSMVFGEMILPIYNSAICINDIFSMRATPLAVTVTTLINLVYSSIFIFVITKMFNLEKVMFSR